MKDSIQQIIDMIILSKDGRDDIGDIYGISPRQILKKCLELQSMENDQTNECLRLIKFLRTDTTANTAFNYKAVKENGSLVTDLDLYEEFKKRSKDDMQSLVSVLKKLVFTASKLWDDVKPIKDTPSITVSHPIIEEAKELLKKYSNR